MPQGIQGSSVGDQLRRAFGLRGLISTAVDEVVVPVAATRTLDTPPFRTDGFSWGLGGQTSAAAGNHSRFGVVPSPSIRAVVNQVIISNLNAAAQVYQLVALGGTYLGPNAVSMEAEHSVVGSANVAIDAQGFLDPALIATDRIGRFSVLPGDSLVIPGEWLIGQPVFGPTGLLGLYVVSEAQNVITNASFAGRYWVTLGE